MYVVRFTNSSQAIMDYSGWKIPLDVWMIQIPHFDDIK